MIVNYPPRLVPEGYDVSQVKLYDGPKSAGHVGCIAVSDEPISVGDQGSGTKGGSVCQRGPSVRPLTE